MLNFKTYSTFRKIFNNKLTLKEAIRLKYEILGQLFVRQIGLTEEEKRTMHIHHVQPKSNMKDDMGVREELADSLFFNLLYVYRNSIEHPSLHYLEAIIRKLSGMPYLNDAKAVQATFTDLATIDYDTLEVSEVSEALFNCWIDKLESAVDFKVTKEKERRERELLISAVFIEKDKETTYTVAEIREKRLLSNENIEELKKKGFFGRKDASGVWKITDSAATVEEDKSKTTPEEPKPTTPTPPTTETKEKKRKVDGDVVSMTRSLAKARFFVADPSTGDKYVGYRGAVLDWTWRRIKDKYENKDSLEKALFESIKKSTKTYKRGGNGVLTCRLTDGKKVSFTAKVIKEDIPSGHRISKKKYLKTFATISLEDAYK